MKRSTLGVVTLVAIVGCVLAFVFRYEYVLRDGLPYSRIDRWTGLVSIRSEGKWMSEEECEKRISEEYAALINEQHQKDSTLEIERKLERRNWLDLTPESLFTVAKSWLYKADSLSSPRFGDPSSLDLDESLRFRDSAWEYQEEALTRSYDRFAYSDSLQDSMFAICVRMREEVLSSNRDLLEEWKARAREDKTGVTENYTYYLLLRKDRERLDFISDLTDSLLARGVNLGSGSGARQ